MEKVEYDLDTSGGIMEEIQKLVAPPQSDDSKRLILHETIKRPAKAINHDRCDACCEDGDLLCCDHCSASFHLQCCNPPLEDADVPTGEWICNECKHGKNIDQTFIGLQFVDKSVKSVSSSRSSSPVDSEAGMNPFEKLTALYQNKNPREFQLPMNIQEFYIMPGDRKRKKPLDCSRKGESQRVCFVCTRTERISSLISCDFCPLVFHQDCLMPPLAQEPIGLWMCPNHPENFEPRLRMSKFSERARIIEELRSNVNHNAVKLDFFFRAKKERILMNRKNYQPKRKKVCLVPDIVKAQYKNPPAQFMPTICQSDILLPHMKPLSTPTPGEKEQWLKSIIDLQCSIAGALEKQKSYTVPLKSISSQLSSPVISYMSSDTSTGSFAIKYTNNTNEVNNIHKEQEAKLESQSLYKEHLSYDKEHFSSNKENILCDKEHQFFDERFSYDKEFSSCDTELVSLYDKELVSPFEKEDMVVEGKKAENCVNQKEDFELEQNNLDATTLNDTSSINLDGLIVSSSPTVQQFQSNISSDCVGKDVFPKLLNVTPKVPSVLTSGRHMVNSISTELLRDPTLSQLDDRLVRILAFQRLQQLVEKKSHQTPKFSKPGITEKKVLLQTTLTKKAIAVLSSLNGLAPACYMRYMTINLGQGADMDLCLSNYGFCNYVSGKHATIFFDKETQQFELLNYSEHGTIVDNVLYSCDFSEKLKLHITSSNAKIESKYQDFELKKKKPPLGRTTKGLGTEFITKSCNCRASASSLIGGSGAGWEGTAVLHHGSYVKLGCLHFVFSIVECNNLVIDNYNLPVKQQNEHVKSENEENPA
ncbi:PHD finger protein 12 isoform X2 [Hydra vulgaris]|uniref:PHD finger protein 12 isoform X2 n=1 Tax=Hydra vulgaris TaxID=6087 RepID=A0ABM4CP61_HYDVU